MSVKRKKTSEAIRIRAQGDGDRPVVLHPEDDDVFVRTGRQVIEACRLGISIEVWMHEFREMLGHVHRWAQQHGSRIRACYAAPRGASIGLYFVPRTETFDFDLAEELAPLNRDLVKAFNIGMIEVHQIPERERDRFISPEAVRTVFCDAQGAP